MTAHLSDSDRQALRLAHDLREELRQALPRQAAPSISPFVDPAGRPSVLMRMDAETARALMALLGERRAGPMAAQPESERTGGIPLAAPTPPAPPMSSPPPFAQGGPVYAGSNGTGPMPAMPGGPFQGGAANHGFGGPEYQGGYADQNSTGTGGFPLMPAPYPGR